MVDDKMNFCKPAMMSECAAADPKACKHYQKSSIHTRCTHQSIQLSDCYHCGCMEAQQEARTNVIELNEEDLELIEEGKEGLIPT